MVEANFDIDPETLAKLRAHYKSKRTQSLAPNYVPQNLTAEDRKLKTLRLRKMFPREKKNCNQVIDMRYPMKSDRYGGKKTDIRVVYHKLFNAIDIMKVGKDGKIKKEDIEARYDMSKVSYPIKIVRQLEECELNFEVRGVNKDTNQLDIQVNYNGWKPVSELKNENGEDLCESSYSESEIPEENRIMGDIILNEK